MTVMVEADALFLDPDEQSVDRYEQAMQRAQAAVIEALVDRNDVYSGATPAELRRTFEDIEPMPDEGEGIEAAVETVCETVLKHAVRFHDPKYLAHLNCAPGIPGIAADAIVAAMNQNHASWDLGPSVDVLEEAMIDELRRRFGYPDGAAGVFTSGGTQANFMGMFLARGWYADEHFNVDVQSEGLPQAAENFRILRSAAGHPTIDEAAAKLGLGEQAVVDIPTDDQYRLDVEAAEAALEELEADGRHPIALAATAGTTDFGSIDPLSQLADLADEYDCWFHVDAAYGGALAMSDRHRGMLAGIERADSLTVDFHKFLFQPVSCGAFLVRDERTYQYIGHEAEYLNPERDSVPHRTEKSVQWSRRADVLKPFVTFRAVGREDIGAMIDRVVALVDRIARCVGDDPDFDLINESELTTVVFRYCPTQIPEEVPAVDWANRVNDRIREIALEKGETIVARTEHQGTTYLKFTILNPKTTVEDVETVLDLIREYGAQAERELASMVAG